jgi:hypothetical protein
MQLVELISKEKDCVLQAVVKPELDMALAVCVCFDLWMTMRTADSMSVVVYYMLPTWIVQNASLELIVCNKSNGKSVGKKLADTLTLHNLQN